MTNLELQAILKKYPDDTIVKRFVGGGAPLQDFTDENICDHATDYFLDDETGELVEGNEKRMIVINPPIY